MLSTSILLLLSVFLFIVYVLKNAKNRPKNFPPGPPRLPFWGSYWFMLKKNYYHPHLSLEALGEQYKTDILGLYLGDAPTVVTFSQELCKELLTREEFLGRNDTIIVRTRALGELRGIFFIDGPYWKEERRFSLRHLRDFGFGRRSGVMEDFVTNEVNYLIKVLSESPNSDIADICRGKGHFLFPDVFYGPLLNSILLVLTSTKFDNFKLRECARATLRFLRSGDATGDAISMTPWLRFVAPDFFGFTPAVTDNGIMLDFLRETLDDHIKTFSNDHYRDFIDVYLGERNGESEEFDYNQLLFVVLDYMFPAAMAIGNTLNFFFAHLVNSPHVQIKIQEEIEQVVGRSRLPNLDDRKLMPYLEASVRETLRIIPLNPLGIPRRCTEDTTLAGYFIPKDTIMLPCVWTAHRDEKIWKVPEVFLPERFLDDSGNLLKKDYTIGFGAGKRLCAGETFARQNMFLIISGLLQNYSFKSPNGKPLDFDIVPGVLLSLRDNWMLAQPR